MNILPEHEAAVTRAENHLRRLVAEASATPDLAERKRLWGSCWFSLHEIHDAITKAEQATLRASLAKLETAA